MLYIIVFLCWIVLVGLLLCLFNNKEDYYIPNEDYFENVINELEAEDRILNK